MKTCYYCLKTKVDEELSKNEHVLSAALGVDLVLQKDVCINCNNELGHKIEGPFVNNLNYFRNLFGISNQKGKIPTIQYMGYVEGREVRFLRDAQGQIKLKHKILLKREELPDGTTEELWRCSSEHDVKELERAFTKRKGIKYSEKIEIPDQTINLHHDINLNFLIEENTLRTICKYALNSLAFIRNSTYVVNEVFSEIRDYIVNGKLKGEPLCHPFFNKYIMKSLNIPIPRHAVLVCNDNSIRKTIAIVVLFGMFYFYVILGKDISSINWHEALFFYPDTREYHSDRLVRVTPFTKIPFSQIYRNKIDKKTFTRMLAYSSDKFNDNPLHTLVKIVPY